ncbi:MAG: SAM-dependent methyltransferase [Acidimicrobiales bacterium]
MAARDWLDWHGDYDRAGSRLALRLEAVQAQVAGALDRAAPGPLKVVSMCAGQGRDLLGVLAGHPRCSDVEARLVELDPRNVERARAAARHAGVEVVEGDASTTSAYEGAVPADVVLVCGVFGHASDDDIRRIVEHLPTLCGPGATVIWTRGGHERDLRPAIRVWFADAGFEEMAFTAADAGGWGVGAHRLVAEPRPFEAGVRLFTFLEELP